MSMLVGLLFVCVIFIFLNVVEVKAETKTIVVPDNFSTIQAAIDNANDGDTIFVKNGVYQVNAESLIVIDKTVSLKGENSENTIVLGVFNTPVSGSAPAIRVAAPDVTISGFTIRDCKTAISIVNYEGERSPTGCRIVSNNILNNSEGIRPQVNNVYLSSNTIADNGVGIAGYNTENVVVSGNTITGNGYGVNIAVCKKITIKNNYISNNTGGIKLSYYGPHSVYGNNITHNSWGIRFAEGCQNAEVYENSISKNGVGVVLMIFPNGGNVAVSGVGNKVFYNMITGNTKQVEYYQLNTHYPETWSLGTDIIQWDNGTVGNYWGTHHGLDKNEDGIADSPYTIDENNQDNYPLMNPIELTVIPEFPSWFMLPILVSVTAVVILYKKKLAKTPNWL
ncbi:MAG: right-handed parallel beta-helix repeat-containing protein [Candidatus Bathyarchaeia archaeon]|jgi:parallel beta-helix repeat protein